MMSEDIVTEAEIKKLSTEELALEVLRIKLHVYDKMAEFSVVLERADNNRLKSMKDLQKIASDLNKLFNQMREADERFNNHDQNEMKKYDDIVTAITEQSKSIQELTDTLKVTMLETRENTAFISEAKFEAEKDKAVSEALEKEKAPFKEYKKRAILVVVTLVTGALVTGLWKLTMFIAKLDSTIYGG